MCKKLYKTSRSLAGVFPMFASVFATWELKERSDGDGNGYRKKAIRSDWQNNNSARESCFVYISCRHCATANVLWSTWAHENNFLCHFSEPRYSPSEPTPETFHQHFPNEVKWNKSHEVWNSATKATFSLPSRCLSSQLSTKATAVNKSTFPAYSFYTFIPLSPNSDQQQFSPNNVHTLSRDKVVRI